MLGRTLYFILMEFIYNSSADLSTYLESNDPIPSCGQAVIWSNKALKRLVAARLTK